MYNNFHVLIRPNKQINDDVINFLGNLCLINEKTGKCSQKFLYWALVATRLVW